jgi:hypothetical protein
MNELKWAAPTNLLPGALLNEATLRIDVEAEESTLDIQAPLSARQVFIRIRHGIGMLVFEVLPSKIVRAHPYEARRVRSVGWAERRSKVLEKQDACVWDGALGPKSPRAKDATPRLSTQV